MTATLPTLSSPLIVVVGGKHTRNRRAVALRTCETCPSDVKDSCVTVCPSMESFLLANGNTISHNSPLWGQMSGSVSDVTERPDIQEHFGEAAGTVCCAMETTDS